MTAYPCISLWQPWASALFLSVSDERLKVHETRSWPAPARLIGRRVAIHAAKKRLSNDGHKIDRALAVATGALDWREAVPFGAVVGTAILAGSFQMSDGAPDGPWDEAFGDWYPSRFAWRMDDPKPLAAPIPWKGQQGWFTVDLP